MPPRSTYAKKLVETTIEVPVITCHRCDFEFILWSYTSSTPYSGLTGTKLELGTCWFCPRCGVEFENTSAVKED